MAFARIWCSPPAAQRCLVIARTPPLAEPCGTWPTKRAPSFAALDEVRPRGAYRVPDDVELVLDGEVPLVVGQLHQRPVAQRRGVVVEHVHAAEALDGGRHPG